MPDTYSRVLEIGCAEGNFSRQLKGFDELWGVEPCSPAALKAERAGYRVINSTFDEALLQLPDDFFDLVVCNDVIEHLPDHDHFFSSIKKKMVKGAVMIGAVPNMRNYRAMFELLIRKDWPYMEMGVLDRTHQRWFTEKSFKRVLVSHGYAVEVYRGIGSLLGNRSSFITVSKSIAVMIVILCTFGYCRDIQFLEFAFRARWNG